jgi:hypothetical protein
VSQALEFSGISAVTHRHAQALLHTIAHNGAKIKKIRTPWYLARDKKFFE